MDTLVRNYGGEIDWNVGALFAHDDYMLKTINLCRQFEDLPIRYVFGSIPCQLQSGRIPSKQLNTSQAMNIMKQYNNNGIGCRLTFSNHLITEEDLNDNAANILMSYLNYKTVSGDKGIKNGVIVASDLLAEYIRDKYPNLELISSLVKPTVEVGLGNDDADYYNDLFNRFDVVVVNSANTRSDEFFKELNHPEKVEFIANHYCQPNCPMAKAHYELQLDMQRESLSGQYSKEMQKRYDDFNKACFAQRGKNLLAGDSLSNNDVSRLVKMGIKHFKIEGRDNSTSCFMRDIADYIFNFHMYSRIMVNGATNYYCH